MQRWKPMRRGAKTTATQPPRLTGVGSGSQNQTNESSREALVLLRDIAAASVSGTLVTACAEWLLSDQPSCRWTLLVLAPNPCGRPLAYVPGSASARVRPHHEPSVHQNR